MHPARHPADPLAARIRAVARLFAGSVLLVTLAGCGGAGTHGPEAAPPPGEAAFVDVTAAAGLGGFEHRTGAEGNVWFPESMGSGCGFIDFDGDGWTDILLAGGGDWSDTERTRAVWLYRNDGDGTFSLASEQAGLEEVDAYALGFAVADYDNDGDQDFYLTTLTKNLLFRNDGGRFTEVAEAAGVAGASVWSASAIFFDADRDGWLDLYVANYVEWTPETDIFCTLGGGVKGYCTPDTYRGVPGRFYRNDGDGTFTDRTEEAGFLPSPGKSLGLTELDFNRDGWPDLMVANDTEPNLLFVNDGDGTFTERGALSGVAYDETGKARAGMGIDAGVVDETGEETVFIGNFSKETIAVFRHDGNGLFSDRVAQSRLGRPTLLTLTFALFLFDAELDGDLDLFAANGHVQTEISGAQDGVFYQQPPHLFLNGGDGTFEDAAPGFGGPLVRPIVARGAAYADFDGDGDQDLLVTENDGAAHLWRNDLADGGTFLRVRLEGRRSSRDAFGARLVARVGARRLERRVRSGSSYLSASEPVATFGLGGAPRVDSLTIHWPSGRVDRLGPLDAGRTIHVVEGTGVASGGVGEKQVGR